MLNALSFGTAGTYRNSVHTDRGPYTSPSNNTFCQAGQTSLPILDLLLTPRHDVPEYFVGVIDHCPVRINFL